MHVEDVGSRFQLKAFIRLVPARHLVCWPTKAPVSLTLLFKPDSNARRLSLVGLQCMQVWFLSMSVLSKAPRSGNRILIVTLTRDLRLLILCVCQVVFSALSLLLPESSSVDRYPVVVASSASTLRIDCSHRSNLDPVELLISSQSLGLRSSLSTAHLELTDIERFVSAFDLKCTPGLKIQC